MTPARGQDYRPACRPEEAGQDSPVVHVFLRERPMSPGDDAACQCGEFRLTFEGMRRPGFSAVAVFKEIR